MKNVLIIFMALTSFAINAQNDSSSKKAHKMEMRENYTPEQRAELRTKQMTLALDLNTAQQTKVKQLFLQMKDDGPANKKSWSSMTDDEKYKAKNAMLDHRIEFKKQMKEILTEEQMAKWEKHQNHRKDNFRKKKHSEHKRKR